MSVLQPISYGLLHQVGPGTGARGFGSYKADNTETMRPYQQEAASPIGRGYPISVVSGSPTVYDPYAGIKEDPVVVLLKKILGMKTKVVDKAPDAGFRNNVQYGGGDTLGAAPADGYSQLETEYGTAQGSTDYGSLNEFKSEFGRLAIDDWVNSVKDVLTESILGQEDISVQATPAFGKSTQTDINAAVIDDLDEMVMQQIAGFERDRNTLAVESERFRRGTMYLRGMIDYFRLTPLTHEDVQILMDGDNPEEVTRIIDDVGDSYRRELNRRVTEASALIADGPVIQPTRRGPGLRINTNVPRARRNPGEQFYPHEREQRVEGGRSMNEYIPLRRNRNR